MIEQSGEPLYWNGIKTFKWKGHYWIARPAWGIVHPNNNMTWIDEKQPEILENGNLLLPFEYNPFDGRPIARSYVRCIEEFKYGTFEWKFILPKGEWLWPALWLSSDAGWPPEIDCLEGWSERDFNYVKRLIFKNIKPSVHWSANADEKNGEHKSETKNNNLRWLIKSDEKVNTAKVVWAPNYIDIYYNGIKIKRFKNKEMLEHFNKNGYDLHPIMSMNVYGQKWEDFTRAMIKNDRSKNLPYMPIVWRNFEIVDFKYLPLK